MKTVPVDYNEIHELVELRRNAFWDGWTAVFVDTKKDGFMQTNGIYFNGKWSIQHRVSPDSKGLWRVPVRHV